MLSGLRLCEAKFVFEHLLWIKPRSVTIDDSETGIIRRKPWFLDFGEYIHWCLEQFYNHFKHNKTAPTVDFWMQQCKTKWELMRMDEYKDYHVEADAKKYKEVHGWEGVATLLIQYYVFYMDMRLRVIDTEITFGHNKEVHLGRIITNRNYEITQPHGLELPLAIDCYLTGRIDLLVDNGYKIGPVDHKTTHRFDGFEHQDFNPHDAMTGYIFTCHELLKGYKEKYPVGSGFPGLRESPQCMGGWIFHVSSCTPSIPRDKSQKQGPRFKTTPVDKTLSQLEDFKKRQLSSFKRVAELLFDDKTPEWNTTACNNIFFRQCEYKPIHEQPSEQWQDVIDRFYQISNPWDTRNMGKKDSVQNEKQNPSIHNGTKTEETMQK
jgi:hypothetical protein